MKFSTFERLLLANQYRILEKLYPGDGYERARRAIENGYEREYGQLIQDIDEPGLSTDECREVSETLAMYEALGDSYKGLAGKGGFDEFNVRFPGYSGNDETLFMTYVEYLVKGGKFAHVATKLPPNSHAPMRGRYRAMLAELGKFPAARQHKLTSDELKTVVDAR